MLSKESLADDEERFFSTYKKIEKYLELQLEVQKNDLGKALDWKFEEAENAMIDMFNEAMQKMSYEFILKKRLLKRLWGILILEI